MNSPWPSPFFAALPLPCIIVNANRRTKNGVGLGTRLPSDRKEKHCDHFVNFCYMQYIAGVLLAHVRSLPYSKWYILYVCAISTGTIYWYCNILPYLPTQYPYRYVLLKYRFNQLSIAYLLLSAYLAHVQFQFHGGEDPCLN